MHLCARVKQRWAEQFAELAHPFAAIAHGHPIGATGAVLPTKLIRSLHRDGLKRGLVRLCIGGGQGIALAIEALH